MNYGVRREAWREAYSEAVQLAKAHPQRKAVQRQIMRNL